MAVTYRFMTNREWGIRYTIATPRTERMPDTEATLHHTAGNPKHGTPAATAFRDLNEAAIRDGYWCVAYDILVHEQILSNNDRIITIGEGRGPWMSGATLDRNEETEAICALGYFHPGHALSEAPSPYMVEGVARGIVWGIQKGWISRNHVLYGHRDNPAHPKVTSCPGDYFWVLLPKIRIRVQELLQPGVEIMHAFIPRSSTINPRILDTRGPAGPNRDYYKLAANTPATVPVPGGIGKEFAILNVTATEQEGSGYMTLWNTGVKLNTSCLNWPGPTNICNEVTVQLHNGTFQMFSSARTHVIIDLIGFYNPI